jgi:hypothetical protein
VSAADLGGSGRGVRARRIVVSGDIEIFFFHFDQIEDVDGIWVVIICF